MLIDELGYRPPSAMEQANAIRKWLTAPHRTSSSVPLSVLHSDPLISYSGVTPHAPLGAASLIGPRLWRKPAWFLLSPTWTIENFRMARNIRRAAVRHRMTHPLHKFIILCNTDAETEVMRGLGEAATTHNKTTNTSETVFRPLEGVEVEFDAIYNAQLASWKRHELAVDIPTCAFLFYRGVSSTAKSEAALISRHMRSAPAHVFLNEFDDAGKPIRFEPELVNFHLNRAAVGLCLSAEEGAMFASAEYQLAGLPVVTTPNRGGRDLYVDRDFCLKIRDDPREIAAAVAALKQRRIPRAVVRERVLRLITSERRKFIDIVNAIYREEKIPNEFLGFWPLTRPVIMRWQPRQTARRMILRGSVDDIILPEPRTGTGRSG